MTKPFNNQRDIKWKKPTRNPLPFSSNPLLPYLPLFFSKCHTAQQTLITCRPFHQKSSSIVPKTSHQTSAQTWFPNPQRILRFLLAHCHRTWFHARQWRELHRTCRCRGGLSRAYLCFVDCSRRMITCLWWWGWILSGHWDWGRGGRC